jgi:thiamine transport system substrate-binding protein
MRNKWIVYLTLAALALAACAQDAGPSPAPPTPAGPQTLTVMTHDSFEISEDVLAAFESQHNARVQFLKAGDTGTALNKAILATNNPLADVFYGVDNTFLSRALAEDIFAPYAAPALAEIPAEFQLDPENRALPVDYGDVCLNYEQGYFAENALAPPQSLEDLVDPAYQGLLVVENPATSSPGLAFLLATVGHFGPEGYLDYWQDLQANGLLVVNDWETAYYTEFSQWGGTRPLVVSYSSSPPFEVIFAEEPLDAPPTAAVTTAGTCFRQIEFVGILKGTANRALAEKWVDFMLSPAFQEDMPLKMAVFPVNGQAVLDKEFAAYVVIPNEPVMISPEEIAANRETWIQEWTETILR